MGFTTKLFTHLMQGAPSMTGVSGSLIAVLDACLINGFGVKAASGLVVATSIATVSFSTSHAFLVGSIIEVSGASPSSLNGEWRVTSVTSTAFTFDCPGIASQTATGSISVRIPQMSNWTKPFVGTNKACYRSNAVGVLGHYLQVWDNAYNVTDGARVAWVRGYETMTDVDTGVDPFPTIAQVAQASGLRWVKSTTANGVARPWALVATDRMIYLFIDTQYSGYPGRGPCFFGDAAPLKAGDQFTTFITGVVGSTGQWYPLGWYAGTNNGSYSNAFWVRAHTGVVGSEPARCLGPVAGNRPSIGVGNVPNPDTITGRLWLAPLIMGDSVNASPRAYLPYVYESLHASKWGNFGDLVTDVDGLTPWVYNCSSGGTNAGGNFFVDLGVTG